MRLGRYTVNPDTLRAIRRMLRDVRRTRRNGIPRMDGTPEDMARAAIAGNAHPGGLRAGAGHFHVMWPTDMGKAFAGAQRVLPHEYLAGQVSRILVESHAAGHVPTCFKPRGHYTLPYPRADGMPWVLHMVALLDDPGFVDQHRRELEALYAGWLREHADLRTGAMYDHVTGDWMDTVPRPSSTYNNLCALRAYEVADALGLDAPSYGKELEQHLLETRWTRTHLRDHPGAGTYVSADANVPALYFGLLPAWVRERMAVAVSPLADPLPMRTREGRYPSSELPLLTRLSSGYHSCTWLHLGMMYGAGLRRLGWHRDADRILGAGEALARRHGNWLETLDARGAPYRSPVMVCEHGFTMASGLYLEAIAGRPRTPELTTDATAAAAPRIRA